MPAVLTRAIHAIRRSSLTGKLFAAMLVVNVLVIGAMAVGAQISFERGFLGYLEHQEIKRLESSVGPLGMAYRDHGSWDFLLENRSLWHEIMRPYAPASYPVSSHAPLPRLPVSSLIGTNTRFTLLDAQGRYVFGNPSFADSSPRRPIVVSGKTVGWLLMVPFERATEAGDLRFQKTQRESSWIIAIAATLLAILTTLWMARALASPLRRIASATHTLAGGDLSARVPTVSSGDIGQLERDFNHLAQTLESTERMRSALVADISHELRTPLAVMSGEIEAIEVGVRPVSVEAVRSLGGEVKRLSRLVDDLYDLSLADVGALRYHHEQTDVCETLRAALRRGARRLSDAGLTLHASLPDAPLWVRGDERRLQQVFTNILENALRYVDCGGAVFVSAREDASTVRIEFDDNGAGVADAYLPSLFERFYRVEASRSRATGGAGLGLPICRGIVEAHGGHIDAARAPQGGLRIAIELPRWKDGAEKDSPTPLLIRTAARNRSERD
ncbi:HAMP domain-containing protein [Paraburkholderia sp. Ac-20340]|uniref:ATP-binding protein n=1 Tax=Paraburkholderia sp. Ac-20340 TaxID=2703888 RepID=UPI0019821C2F|nr:ATP-binding protein [Paraburkholderia sp. Ac-20340]MBN3857509.1 HAMP domain-containing protein [Paraburkholderia sp. Ac-20340]